MARCPSCGRETLRTEDWACQWCGYPLMSGAYRKIEKTYRQLKEERLRGVEEPLPEPEPEVTAEPEEVAEPEPEPEKEKPEEIEVKEEVEAAVEPEKRVEEGEEAVPETGELVEEEEEKVQEPEPEPEAEQEIKPEENAPDEAVVTAEAEPESEPEPETRVENEAEAEAEVEEGKEPEPEAEPEPEPELKPADMELNVTEMFEAYQEDDAAADKRFVGKVIKMTGVISIIDIKSVSDMHCIRLTGNEKDLMQSVKCMFGKQHAQSLMRLEKGQSVTVQGKYDGSIIAMRMVDCVLVE